MPIGERLYRVDTGDLQGPARLHPVWKWDPDRSREGREDDRVTTSKTEVRSSGTKSGDDGKESGDAIDIDSDSDDGMDIS